CPASESRRQSPQTRDRAAACATCSASLATKSPVPAANAFRDDVPSLVPCLQIRSTPDAAPLPATCRAEGSLRWPVSGELPFPRQVPDRVAACEKKSRSGGTIPESSQSFAVSIFRHREYAAHHTGQSLPASGVFRKLLAASFGERIKLGFAVVPRRAPLRGNPGALLQPDQRRVNGSLIQQHSVAADLLDAPGDAVAVQRPQSCERL